MDLHPLFPVLKGIHLTAVSITIVGYILPGAVALTYGPNKPVRTIAFAGAMLCFIYVVSVALTKNPLPFS